jgi:hypothetical protein
VTSRTRSGVQVSQARAAGLRVSKTNRPPVPRGRPHGPQRGAQLLVAEEDLEGVALHDDEVELVVPQTGSEIAQHPLHAGRPAAGLHEHRGRRIQADEPAGVAGVRGPGEQPARAAADVEDGLGGHHEVQVEVVVRPPRIDAVVQRGERGIRERMIDHRGSLPHRGDPQHKIHGIVVLPRIPSTSVLPAGDASPR